MNLIRPMYKKYSSIGLVGDFLYQKKLRQFVVATALLITKGHKATGGGEKNKEIYQRDDAPDLAADPSFVF